MGLPAILERDEPSLVVDWNVLLPFVGASGALEAGLMVDVDDDDDLDMPNDDGGIDLDEDETLAAAAPDGLAVAIVSQSQYALVCHTLIIIVHSVISLLSVRSKQRYQRVFSLREK